MHNVYNEAEDAIFDGIPVQLERHRETSLFVSANLYYCMATGPVSTILPLFHMTHIKWFNQTLQMPYRTPGTIMSEKSKASH